MRASKPSHIPQTDLTKMASRIDTLRQELDSINKEHGFLLTDATIASCYSTKMKERNILEKRIQLANKKTQKQTTTEAPTLSRLMSPPSPVGTRSSTPEMPTALGTQQPEEQTKKPRNYWKWDSELGKLRSLMILTALLDLRTDDDLVRTLSVAYVHYSALPHIPVCNSHRTSATPRPKPTKTLCTLK